MRRTRILITVVTLTCAAGVSAEAQTITLYDDSAPRASLKIGYGGHGLDWDGSIDGHLIANRIRFRGGVGRGRWDSEFDSYDDPTVTRLAASALYFIPTVNDLKPYIGLGYAAYFARGSDLNAQTGARLTLGAEGSGERWTIGVEVELDLPHPDPRPFPDHDLYFAGRIGLSMRRRF